MVKIRKNSEILQSTAQLLMMPVIHTYIWKVVRKDLSPLVITTNYSELSNDFHLRTFKLFHRIGSESFIIYLLTKGKRKWSLLISTPPLKGIFKMKQQVKKRSVSSTACFATFTWHPQYQHILMIFYVTFYPSRTSVSFNVLKRKWAYWVNSVFCLILIIQCVVHVLFTPFKANPAINLELWIFSRVSLASSPSGIQRF